LSTPQVVYTFLSSVAWSDMQSMPAILHSPASRCPTWWNNC